MGTDKRKILIAFHPCLSVKSVVYFFLKQGGRNFAAEEQISGLWQIKLPIGL
jgi:hypothetical protein